MSRRSGCSVGVLVGGSVLLLLSLAAGSCARTATPAPGTTTSTAVPSSVTPVPPRTVELREDGIGGVSFGEPMTDAMPSLIALLGRPVNSEGARGVMPFGYDGMDARGRMVTFHGIRVLFGDWVEGGGDVLRFVAWGAWGPRSADGTPLLTSEGIGSRSTVAELREAFGSSLMLPVQEWCTSAPWYWGADPDMRYWGTLTDDPAKPGSRVLGLQAGPVPEGVWVDECW
jgi:hypothetical protein